MNGLLTVILILVGVVGAGLAIFFLLSRVTLWGGDRRDGLDNANKFMTETDAFRGSATEDAPPLDGTNRIARPDAGAHSGL